MATPSTAVLTSYAIAVYDPSDLLDVQATSVTSSGPPAPQATATSTVPTGSLMTGGCAKADSNGLLLTASYPISPTQWHGAVSMRAGYEHTGSITVSAISVKWANPTGLPTLNTVIQSSTGGSSARPTASVAIAGTCTLVGGGALQSTGNTSTSNMLTTSYPSSTRQWTAGGAGAAATMTAYAIGLQVLWYPIGGGQPKAVAFGPGCLIPPQGYTATPPA